MAKKNKNQAQPAADAASPQENLPAAAAPQPEVPAAPPLSTSLIVAFWAGIIVFFALGLLLTSRLSAPEYLVERWMMGALAVFLAGFLFLLRR